MGAGEGADAEMDDADLDRARVDRRAEGGRHARQRDEREAGHHLTAPSRAAALAVAPDTFSMIA